MASLVGAFAASHGPLIARDWTILPPAVREHLNKSFRELGRRFAAVRADVIIEVSPDHWSNFFLDNLPAICIGVGDSHGGPPEAFVKEYFPHETVPGHAALAMHIAKIALKRDFEPSISHHMKLDHGFCIPLWQMGVDPLPKIIPIAVNGIEPPMMSIRRCLAWGRLIAEAVKSYPENLRVAVLATGGLSHSIGQRTMGAIDEPFDHETLRLFAKGDDAALVDFLEAALPRTGNGGHEVRNWVVAHGAADSRGFELVAYEPVPEVYVGCGYAAWQIPAAA
jgi:aromatic ring-opening dioxygenase catalytic subunit (LigB family)